MGRVISFNNDVESTNLNSWISSFHDENEMRTVFLNIDRAMKYIHDRGYCIKSFDPRQIEILNNSIDQIKFNTLLEMPDDSDIRKRIIKEDIYNSSFIQIGLYAKCLNYLDPQFLKSNFDKFSQFLPEGDVPYYRGVIERGASVYFCEYAKEKRNRDLSALESELGGSVDSGKSLIKSNGIGIYDDTNVNDRINDNIYKQINGMSDAAFASFLIFPTIILAISVAIVLIVWVFSMV